MNSSIAHIVYSSDAKFAEILGVSLVSLYENSKDMEDIVLYILDGGISENDKERIERVSADYGRSLPKWIDAKNICQELGMRVKVDRGSHMQYARIFLSRHLDDTLDRILYLDCDLIVRKSIRELWNMDLYGKTVAALKDPFSRYYRGNIGLKPTDIIFNSGVMLIDLKKWRENNIESRALDFISRHNGEVEKGDQGALNAVLSKDTCCFHPKYNAVTVFFDFTYEEMLRYRQPPDYYSKNEVLSAVDDPVIIHYTRSFLSKRPWMQGCEHRYKEEWLKYKTLSPWKGFPLWNERRSWRVRAIRKLPKGLMLCVAGILQVYGRPLKNRLKSVKGRISHTKKIP